jgi:hypothetical protein
VIQRHCRSKRDRRSSSSNACTISTLKDQQVSLGMKSSLKREHRAGETVRYSAHHRSGHRPSLCLVRAPKARPRRGAPCRAPLNHRCRPHESFGISDGIQDDAARARAPVSVRPLLSDDRRIGRLRCLLSHTQKSERVETPSMKRVANARSGASLPRPYRCRSSYVAHPGGSPPQHGRSLTEALAQPYAGVGPPFTDRWSMKRPPSGRRRPARTCTRRGSAAARTCRSSWPGRGSDTCRCRAPSGR